MICLMRISPEMDVKSCIVCSFNNNNTCSKLIAGTFCLRTTFPVHNLFNCKWWIVTRVYGRLCGCVSVWVCGCVGALRMVLSDKIFHTNTLDDDNNDDDDDDNDLW